VNAVNTMKKAKLFSRSPVLLAQGSSQMVRSNIDGESIFRVNWNIKET